jgi:hypothetical protein
VCRCWRGVNYLPLLCTSGGSCQPTLHALLLAGLLHGDLHCRQRAAHLLEACVAAGCAPKVCRVVVGGVGLWWRSLQGMTGVLAATSDSCWRPVWLLVVHQRCVMVWLVDYMFEVTAWQESRQHCAATSSRHRH